MFRRKTKYYAPAIIWGIGIFIISSVPDLTVTSKNITLLDKIAHFGEFYIFGIFLIYGFSRSSAATGKILRKQISISLVYGILDEFHQLFIPGREAEFLDLLADFTGAVFAALTYIILKRWKDYKNKIPNNIDSL